MVGELAAPETVHATRIWLVDTSRALSDAEQGTKTREPKSAALPYGEPPIAALTGAVVTWPRLAESSR